MRRPDATIIVPVIAACGAVVLGFWLASRTGVKNSVIRYEEESHLVAIVSATKDYCTRHARDPESLRDLEGSDRGNGLTFSLAILSQDGRIPYVFLPQYLKLRGHMADDKLIIAYVPNPRIPGGFYVTYFNGRTELVDRADLDEKLAAQDTDLAEQGKEEAK